MERVWIEKRALIIIPLNHGGPHDVCVMEDSFVLTGRRGGVKGSPRASPSSLSLSQKTRCLLPALIFPSAICIIMLFRILASKITLASNKTALLHTQYYLEHFTMYIDHSETICTTNKWGCKMTHLDILYEYQDNLIYPEVDTFTILLNIKLRALLCLAKLWRSKHPSPLHQIYSWLAGNFHVLEFPLTWDMKK